MRYLVLFLLATALVQAQQAKPTAAKPATKSAVVLTPDDFVSDMVLTQALPKCANLPPVCAGGLLKQSASVDKINAYIAKYLAACAATSPPTCTCRFMQPPRCYTGQKRTCAQECIP
jgi:hypothetical protein